ncbi:MAG: TetR/AcrR family transcriptional regulator [Candidatus Phaeomarinobacter sp.]
MARPQMGDERREQILEAFEKCVVRKGLAKTTLSDVADESSLPRSLVRYFVGNRADMVDLLIDRMIERGDDGVAKLRPKSRPMTTYDLADFLFDNTFANDVSNNVVGELWYMAERDDKIRKRLALMYGRVVKLMMAQMERDSLGRSADERREAAGLILSLVYGQTSFRELGVPHMARETGRAHARAILSALPKSS